MKLQRIRTLLFALPLAAAGCMRPAVGTSPELVDARLAYARAAASPATIDARQQLFDANRSLAEAERMHAIDPASPRERHLALIAKRRAELAIARAETRAAMRDAEAARGERARVAEQAARAADEAARAAEAAQAQLQVANEQRAAAEQAASASRAELDRLEGELAETRRQLTEKSTEIETQRLKDREVALQAQIDALQAERDRAQKDRDRALATVREFASVNEEADRGLVITVPAEVMFPTGSAKLRPRAKEKLDELATALTSLGADQTFVIEGHTDARGSAAFNKRLSKRRANAVRAYLIEQGVDADRILARGRGEAQPVASNTEPEGRAENRRVEIVVSPSAVSRR